MNKTPSIEIYQIPKDESNVEYYESIGCIIDVLRENYSDEQINQMSPMEIFEEVCQYDGLLGNYAGTITGWIEDIFEIDLYEISNMKKEIR